MKNTYIFSKEGCCKTYVTKYELVEIHEAYDHELSSMSSNNKATLQQSEIDYTTPINGKLFLNKYITYCMGCRVPCSRYGFEIEGHQTKLTEAKTQCCYSLYYNITNCFCGCIKIFYCCHCCYPCCPPIYEVEDRNNRPLGELKASCCTLFSCCRSLSVSTPTQSEAFNISPVCCLCCRDKWNIRDQTGTEVATIETPCCSSLCGQKISINFLANFRNTDKLLLMSSIPFLP